MAWSSTTKMRIPRSVMSMGGDALLCAATPKHAVNQKVEPSPTTLLTPTVPPIMVARLFEMANPSPVPPYWRVMEVSACSKL